MSECKTSVTTTTGTFTFHNDGVPRCKAKLLCAQKGEILAPFTNQADVDAVYGLQNWDCDFYRFTYSFNLFGCSVNDLLVILNNQINNLIL